jgi:hypothetical protein
MESMEQPLKILNLVLYSEHDEYKQMKQITEKYYQRFPNVKTVYYTFSDQEEPYRMKKNTLYIKGQETYIPGIIDKTKKAILYFANDYEKYDYIVRSNISTIINFDLLSQELKKQPIDYGNGLIIDMESYDIDTIDGVKKFKNVKYASGTSIIMSKRVIKQMVKKNKWINEKIIDDAAIGMFIQKHLPGIQMTHFAPEKFLFVPDYGSKEELTKEITRNHRKYIFYRNRCDDRKRDVEQMADIVNIITGNPES